ncbi:protein-methionine-sulfoxide reductase catalytic subunit MsrP [Betaproteobacteria bacterium LSUCC0117]|jgi:methionine sulfoxide reductase catalytic subunit|nr:protein-methionine-sulfoxide reductase catalytic subunit MsrP [Betaproteobacteria bacterium LSUCC0117]MDP4670639.1 protein-methionine-sulfoxide reductase catalytic subunit MsrP [Burkholderiaceae bacterium]MDP4863397.1 protein-methionine-sulfoxide reductase catalytic subunit MsrP [Burkholderiaceae bacterium]
MATPRLIVTPESVWLQRRQLLKLAGISAASGVGLGAGAVWAQTRSPQVQPVVPMASTPSQVRGARATDKVAPWKDATTYNNFYEFGTDKSDPYNEAHRLITSPWQVRVEGLVNKPTTFDIDDLRRLAPIEERIYRLRCVEGWSMVIPWLGYSLSNLIAKVQPQGSAKYVAFQTLADRETMPGLRYGGLDWPYSEGLRLDEAMHPLTLLTLGMYGKTLPNQSGAPVRLVVPWKYGFKSAKSIVTIRLTEKQPKTAWNEAAPHEYGFYSNVNPAVNHPRWSQATERRLGEGGLFAKRLETQLFNGYADEVGQLYAGMDLRRNF